MDGRKPRGVDLQGYGCSVTLVSRGACPRGGCPGAAVGRKRGGGGPNWPTLVDEGRRGGAVAARFHAVFFVAILLDRGSSRGTVDGEAVAVPPQRAYPWTTGSFATHRRRLFDFASTTAPSGPGQSKLQPRGLRPPMPAPAPGDQSELSRQGAPSFAVPDGGP